jgi:hypothetical protein
MGLATWLVVCVAAFGAEVLRWAGEDPGRLLPPLGTILLVALLAMQAFRIVVQDRRLRSV